MTNVKRKYPIKAIKDIGKITDDGLGAFDLANNKLVYANKAFLKILKTSKKELSATPQDVIRQRVKDDWKYAIQYWADIKSKGKIENIEFRLKFSEMEKFVLVDAFLLDEGNLLIATVRETTAAKQHFNYIVEFGARKDALLDMIAHNLSGPLNLTTNLLNAIDQETKNQQYKKIDDYSRLIRESTQQCIEIINSFLKEEHSESERIFAKRNLFNVITKVKIIADNLKQFNKDKQFEIISARAELMVNADDVKFFQVVHNLLSNAVKFTPPQGKISVTINDYEHFFEVVVADTGIGIPEHLLPYVYQRNTPASREGLKGEKSIGMGLYIVRKLVEIMRGSVSIESEENTGTTFTVRLPKD